MIQIVWVESRETVETTAFPLIEFCLPTHFPLCSTNVIKTKRACDWGYAIVAIILDRQEYVGDTINFRTYNKSFKQKKRYKHSKEEWKVFPNPHPAIVDRETFARSWNFIRFQLFCNLRRAKTTDAHLEDTPDHLCRRFVDHPLVFV